MDEFTLREELLKGEDSTRQFKRRIDTQDRLAAEIVAFLNTRGGRIFVGVEDDGTISGIAPEDQGRNLENLISNTCSDSVNPPCGVLTFNLNTKDGMVMVIEVPDGAEQVYQDARKVIWQKKGADKRKVTSVSELKRMFRETHIEYADQQGVPGTTVDDLNLNLLKPYYSEKSRSGPLSDDEEERERQLRGLYLMKGERLTLTAVLLFGKSPSLVLPDFVTKLVWFKGTEITGNEYRDSRRLEGTLQDQYEQAMLFFKRWNSKIQSSDSFNSSGTSEIPMFVFEEILVNAYIHRDYYKPGSVRIHVFDDRIEIISPGSLPNSLTSEDALKGLGTERNHRLAYFAYDLMNYKSARSGLLRAAKAVPGIQLQNNIEQEEVTVTIPL